VDLATAASELYGGAPEDFVERRKGLAAEAKKAGDAELARRVGGLRRPTVSAWAINRLARSAPDELGELLDVGAGLRTAWASGGQIGELDQRRGELIARLARTTASLAEQEGRPLRESAAREVQDTLHAATMDPAVADEVRSGTLGQPRSYVGFVPVGGAPEPSVRPARRSVAPAEAKPRGGGGKSREEARKRQEAEKEQAEKQRRRRLAEQVAAAEAEAGDAERALAEWESEVAEAGRTGTAVTEEAERLRRELNAVLERQENATKRLSMALRERDRAARRATEARRRSDEARRKLGG
jgi:hypothetical protein